MLKPASDAPILGRFFSLPGVTADIMMNTLAKAHRMSVLILDRGLL
jgi:hypothetical protein